MIRSQVIFALEQKLDAQYVCDLTGGHMGASIVKFRTAQGRDLVVKFRSGPDVNDIQDNIYGYETMRQLGAVSIIPGGYAVEIVDNNPVIIMDYLGTNFGTGCNLGAFEVLISGLREITSVTLRKDQDGGEQCVREVFSKMRFFAHQMGGFLPDGFIKNLQTSPALPCQRTSLFLLDFTPGNIFVVRDKICFIDPWRQSTYLGNPAVSIGQFATLACDVYRLAGADKGSELLETFACGELASILDCQCKTAFRNFQLGRALQFLLSAYVRMESNPDLARSYAVASAQALRSGCGKE